MKLLGSTKKDVDGDKDGEDLSKLESIEVILVHFNLVINNYQETSKELFTFVSNKQFGQLITIAPDQNRKQLEIEDDVNMKLINGQIQK